MVAVDEQSLRARGLQLLNRFRQSVDDEFETDRLLVAGSGGGYNARCFAKLFEEVHTLDVCKREYDDLDNHGVIGDGKRLPYASNAFDVVIAVSVVEHVLPLDERPKFVAELVRCTRPDGHVFMQIPNNDFFMELHTGLPFIQWVPRGEEAAARVGYESLHDIEIPDRDELVDWLMAANAEIKSVDGLVYRKDVIPKFETVYTLLDAMGMFSRVPFGWTVTASPRPNSA